MLLVLPLFAFPPPQFLLALLLAAWPAPAAVSRLPVPTFCLASLPPGLSMPPWASSCMVFMRSRMPMPDICFIMSAMPSNCLTSSLTSCGSTPAPAAMRRRRLWSIDLRRVAALVGRHRVDDAHQPAHVGLGVDVAQHLAHAAHAGDHAHDLVDRPELLGLAEHAS